MRLHILNDRPIHGDNDPDGRLEIIDDVGISDEERRRLLEAFTVPTNVVDLVDLSRNLWELVQSQVPQDGHVVYLCPGNGAWLVERALASIGIRPSPMQPIDVSRESDSEIVIDGQPDHVVIIEDVVETGETAHRMVEQLRDLGCPVTLAVTMWHYHNDGADQVLERLGDYHQVLVAVRAKSDNPLDDVRSLSTLVRKADLPKNQRYSKGRTGVFMEWSRQVMSVHDWLHRLGVDLGYRLDRHSLSRTGSA